MPIFKLLEILGIVKSRTYTQGVGVGVGVGVFVGVGSGVGVAVAIGVGVAVMVGVGVEVLVGVGVPVMEEGTTCLTVATVESLLVSFVVKSVEEPDNVEAKKHAQVTRHPTRVRCFFLIIFLKAQTYYDFCRSRLFPLSKY